jgi:hypothetical protein
MKVIEDNIWNKFKKIEILSSNKYSSYYKVKNINTGNYFGVKEINKQNSNFIIMIFKLMKEIKNI